MPYGIQQPAISGQLLQLEKELGVKLFERRPFALTPAGRELQAFVDPFFGKIAETAARLRQVEDKTLRLAASATILRDYLPSLLQEQQRAVPGLTLKLHDANQQSAERLLRAQEIDLAISELENRPAAGVRSAVLLRLPLALIAPAKLHVRSALEILRAPARYRLVSLPAHEVLAQQFQRQIRRSGQVWPVGIEVSSLDLVARYVSLGLGVGLGLKLPGAKLPRGVRLLPLKGFQPLVIALLWQRHLSPANALFLAAVREQAAKMQRRVKSEP